MAALAEDYMADLPNLPLSRCPFTGDVFSMAIDTQGLDGLWWNSDRPMRPSAESLSTFFALDGALKLEGSPERFPFICAPGPDVPYVLPRLLAYVQVKAVVSCIKVGQHTAYPVIYFSDPPLDGVKRVNDWGTERYWETGTPIPELLTPGQWVQLTPDPGEWAFDLAPWIKAGKVLWIAPEDDHFVLRSTVSDCPYLQLSGSHQAKYIQDAKVWESAPDTDADIETEIESPFESEAAPISNGEKGGL
jgi:hypothetical protein